jgi:hypothetical protein
MVGIYAKIKNGLNWLQDTAYKKALPFIGKLGDFAKSDLVKGVVGLAAPALNGIVPGLGAGVNAGLNYLGKFGDMANNAAADYAANPFGIVDGIQNFTSGKYNRPSKGIGLARRPDKLHNRIKLKALPPPDDEPKPYNGPNIEEID